MIVNKSELSTTTLQNSPFSVRYVTSGSFLGQFSHENGDESTYLSFLVYKKECNSIHLKVIVKIKVLLWIIAIEKALQHPK